MAESVRWRRVSDRWFLSSDGRWRVHQANGGTTWVLTDRRTNYRRPMFLTATDAMRFAEAFRG